MSLKSLPALAEAIAAVKKEAGDSAEHKSLLASLSSLSKELGGDAEAKPGKAERDSDSDDYSFAAAEKRHVARNAETRDGGEPQGGESK